MTLVQISAKALTLPASSIGFDLKYTDEFGQSTVGQYKSLEQALTAWENEGGSKESKKLHIYVVNSSTIDRRRLGVIVS